jgi:hypothetical protein
MSSFRIEGGSSSSALSMMLDSVWLTFLIFDRMLLAFLPDRSDRFVRQRTSFRLLGRDMAILICEKLS